MRPATILAFGMAAMLGLSAPASAGLLTVQVDRKEAGVNEFFVVSVTVSARQVRLVVPTSPHFDIQGTTSLFDQPMECMNMGYTVFMGPCLYSFRFFPRSAGELTIPAFQLVSEGMFQGRVLETSDPIIVKATGDPAARRVRSPGKGPAGGGRPVPEESAEDGRLRAFPLSAKAYRPEEVAEPEAFAGYDVFVLPVIHASQLWLNLPFRVDFDLYVAATVGQLQLKDLELPDLEGFRKEQIDPKKQVPERQVALNGKRFSVHSLARYVLLPMEAGTRQLGAARVRFLGGTTSYRQFGGGFSIHIQTSGTQEFDAYSPTVFLSVLETPAPRPDGFDQANVGQFRIEGLEVPPAQPAGSWMMLKYDVSGTGNLYSVAVPLPAAQAGLEFRKPYVDRSGVAAGEGGVSGQVKVQVPFRMRQAGTVRFPPLALAYFDPDKAAYAREETGETVVVASDPEAGSEAQVVAEEIAAIMTERGGRKGDGRDLIGWPVTAGVLGGGLAAYLLALGVRQGVRAAMRDSPRRQARLAVAQARRELAAARQGGSPGAHAAVWRALALYLEGRFGISTASATHDRVEKELVGLGVGAELAARVRAELESAEFGRFAPGGVLAADADKCVARARALLAELDRVKR